MLTDAVEPVNPHTSTPPHVIGVSLRVSERTEYAMAASFSTAGLRHELDISTDSCDWNDPVAAW